MWKYIFGIIILAVFMALHIMGIIYRNGCMFWTGLILFHVFWFVAKWLVVKDGRMFD